MRLIKRMDVSFDFQDTGTNRKGEKWVIARINSSSVDADGDVLIPAGAELIEYRKNPIIKWMHGISDASDPKYTVIGKAVGIHPRPTDIVAKIVYDARPRSLPDSVEWPPDTVHYLHQQGLLNGFSVGADVHPGGMRHATPDDVHRFGKGVRRIVHKWALREVSVVDLPSNPDAWVLEVSKGRIDKSGWVYQRVEQALADWELKHLDDEGRLDIPALDGMRLKPLVLATDRPVLRLKRASS